MLPTRVDRHPRWAGAGLITDWLSGHTHRNASFKAQETAVLSNYFCNDSKRLSSRQKRTVYRPVDPQAIIQI